MTRHGASRSSNAATGVLKSRGLARQFAPIGPRPGSVEFLPVILADKAPRRPLQNLDPVDKPARQNRDFLGFQINHPQFGAEPKPSFLRHHQQFRIGTVEILVLPSTSVTR